MSMFGFDPEIKRECIWNGPLYRPASALIDRNGPAIKALEGRKWQVISSHIATYHSLFDQIADPMATPEAFMLRETIRGWRFYDHFRTDKDAPARQPQLGTRTPFCTMTAAIWPLPYRPLSKLVTKRCCIRQLTMLFPAPASVS